MKKRLFILCIGLFISAQAQEKKTAADFDWLAGCWERGGENWSGVEQWMKPDGGAMFGMSRTVVNGKLREFEFLQIREGKNGELFYVAMPSGQKETRFQLVEMTAERAVFENKAHDFPQRIIYNKPKDGVLVATIEGNSGGENKSIDFTMRRADCN